LLAYSSWKLDRTGPMTTKHPTHLGIVKEASGVGSITLDQFVMIRGINQIKLIKIDTDGHELRVLNGSREILKNIRPYVIFECGQYVLKENHVFFSEFESLFNDLNYKLYDLSTNKLVTLQNFSQIVPLNSTTDIIAVPN